MPTLYISPTGSGSGDGSSAANAATLNDLPRLIAAAGAGGEVRLIADQGAYAAPGEPLSIVAGGISGAPVTIRGVDSAGNPMAAEIIGTRPEPFDPANPPGEEVFRLLGGADNIVFTNLSFQDVGLAFRVGADIAGLTIEHVAAANVARFFDDIASGSNATATIRGLTIRDVDVNGYSKGAIRIRYDSSDVLIQDVRADSQFQDGDNFAIGIHLDDTVHGVLVERVAMRNALDTLNQYRNGDGFATERGTYDITLRNIIATGNSDGGLDLKTDGIVVDGAIVSGNGRNIRLWGTGAKLSNIVSLDAGAPLPGGNREHVWLGAGATATITKALFSDPGSPTLFNLAEQNGNLLVQDVGLALGAGATLSKKGQGSVLTLSGQRAAAATGTSGNDLLLGTVGSDNLAGGDGHDMLAGRAAGDLLNGGAGDDLLDGGAGDDILAGGAGRDILVGGAGRDMLSYAGSVAGVRIDLLRLVASGGDAEGDLFDGFEDVQGSSVADTLIGNNGDNRLFGGAGDDLLQGGTGNDRLAGGTGADGLDGGGGFDRADYSGSAAAVSIDLATAVASGGDAAGDRLVGIEAVTGSALADFLGGTSASDVLDGNAGADRIEGRAGDDVLIGGAGADALVGGDGRDTADYGASGGAVVVDLGSGTGLGADAEGDRLEGIEQLVGSSFGDSLIGDANDNWLIGGAGADTLRGGGGYDMADYSGSGVAVAVDLAAASGSGGEAQGDRLFEIENVAGSGFDDQLAGDGGNNLLIGGNGNDRLAGRGGADWLEGAAGEDIADYSASAAAVIVDLRTGTGQGGDAAGDLLLGIEHLAGSAFDDVLYGDAGANRLASGGGADILDGGEGRDLADYSASASAVRIDLALAVQAGGDASGDQLVSIEAILGSAHGDSLSGSGSVDNLYGADGNDHIDGRDGDDLLFGGAGADELIGGEGIDTADYSGNATAISINLQTGLSSGGEAEGDRFTGVERFIGSAFADTLIGDGGGQLLVGGAGADLIDGDGGFDTAIFAASSAGVTVNLSTNVNRGSDAEGDSLTGIEALVGSAYADRLTGDTQANRIEAGDGNDTIDGGAGGDVMIGGAGDDSYVVDEAGDQVFELVDSGTDIVRTSLSSYVLAENVEDLSHTGTAGFTGIGNALGNSLYGSAASDALYGLDGDDKLVGGLGADLIDGGGGRDQIDYTKSAAITVNLVTNQNRGGEAEGDRLYGIEVVVGSNYADTMTGSDDPLAGDTLYGRGGNDVLNGGAGDDLIDGGAGGDLMTGGAGNDTYIVYEAGDQLVEAAGGGTDRVRTAAAAYVLSVNVEELVYTGTVAASLTGNAGDNLIVGQGSADTLRGGDGADTLRGGAGGDLLDGGAGSDTVDYSGSLGAVRINLRSATASGADALGDRLVSIENAKGGSFGDTLLGSASANLLLGAEGNDTLSGDDGSDTLYGGVGADRLDGGKNEDVLYGEDGDDRLVGGQQADRVYGGIGNDWLLGDTEWVSSLAARDILDGGDGDDVLIGDGVSFTTTGRGADDRLMGGAGNDMLIGDGQSLAGGAIGGIDTLDGGAGDDMLYGDGVTLAPGARGGADKLSGGAGSDRFVFVLGSGRDEISDFKLGGEADLIDLSAFDITYEALRFSTSSSGVTVQLNDIDWIFVRGLASLDQADFIFA